MYKNKKRYLTKSQKDVSHKSTSYDKQKGIFFYIKSKHRQFINAYLLTCMYYNIFEINICTGLFWIGKQNNEQR